MEQLNPGEVQTIIISLQYSKIKFESIPIGPTGYPSYEFKRKKIDEIELLIDKLRRLKL
jgi:hypothetical protein